MRRNLVSGAAACGAAAPMQMACSSGTSHDEAARSLRRPIAANTGERTQLMHELVRYATLAPSSHNTQCWRFRVHDQGPDQGGKRSITIEPDLVVRFGRGPTMPLSMRRPVQAVLAEPSRINTANTR